MHNLGAAYGTRPSDIVGIPSPWAAYQFDVSVMVFGRWAENRIRDGENVMALLHDDYGKGPGDGGEGRFRSLLGLASRGGRP